MDAITPPSIKERPIIFSAAMVRAILEGRKTQTRRIINPQPKQIETELTWKKIPGMFGVEHASVHMRPRCPYGKPGDRLWVRESWQVPPCWNGTAPSAVTNKGFVFYPADEPYERESFLRPSVHMPRWASRIILEIVSVRVERLQDISEVDARAEGCEGLSQRPFPRLVPGARDVFKAIWNGINGKPLTPKQHMVSARPYRASSWEANPWVWVIEFKRVDA